MNQPSTITTYITGIKIFALSAVIALLVFIALGGLSIFYLFVIVKDPSGIGSLAPLFILLGLSWLISCLVGASLYVFKIKRHITTINSKITLSKSQQFGLIMRLILPSIISVVPYAVIIFLQRIFS